MAAGGGGRRSTGDALRFKYCNLSMASICTRQSSEVSIARDDPHAQTLSLYALCNLQVVVEEAHSASLQTLFASP